VTVLDWAWSRLLDAPRPQLALACSYAVVTVTVALEVGWLAHRPGPTRDRVLRSARTAAAMGGGALVVGLAYTVALREIWAVVAPVRWEALARFWADHAVLGAAVAFVLWDAVGWLYHLVGHRTRIGWAAHQPHHSGTEFDLTLGLRQTWLPLHGLVLQPLLALVGFDLATVVVCAAVSNCWQVLEHTSVPVRFPPWVASVVMTPAAHRQHHGRDAGAVNLGPVFTCWDRMAGTWLPVDRPAPTAYGPGPAAPTTALAIELAGWVELLRPAQAMVVEASEYGAATVSEREASQPVMSVAAAGRHNP
jgi:sterol desaturase/sphingolipid hydroxylase (fatty acid hydroxylase superfamily)